MQKLIDYIISLSPIITVIISGLISYFTAKIKVKHELKKISLKLEYKDKVLFTSAFSSVMTLTKDYCDFSFPSTKYEAIKANSELMILAPSQFKPVLQEMDSALLSGNISEINSARKRLQELYLQIE